MAAEDSLKFRVEQWAILMLTELTGSDLPIRRKVEEETADDSCILVDVEIGKRSLEGDRHFEGKLTVELRCLQNITADDYQSEWAAIADGEDGALKIIASTEGDAYAEIELPNGLLVLDEDAEADKEEWSDNFRHMSRTIPILVCP